MTKNIYAVVYHPEHCQKCRMTLQLFQKYGIYAKSFPVSSSMETQVEGFKQKGYSSYPVVYVLRGSTLLDSWCDWGYTLLDSWRGFRPDKIKHIVKLCEQNDI